MSSYINHWMGWLWLPQHKLPYMGGGGYQWQAYQLHHQNICWQMFCIFLWVQFDVVTAHLCSGQVQAQIPLGQGKKKNILFWFNCSVQPNYHFCKWQLCPWLTFVPNMKFPFTINTYFLTFTSGCGRDGGDILATRLPNTVRRFTVVFVAIETGILNQTKMFSQP